MTSLTSRAALPQTQSLFFKLSGELRNEVYHLLLNVKNPSNATEIYLCSKFARVQNKDSFATKHGGVDLNLLATCRQIYLEASGICYSINPIGIDKDMMLATGIDMDRMRLESIRHLRVHIMLPETLASMCTAVQRYMPGVETLEVVFDHGFNYDFYWDNFCPHNVHARLDVTSFNMIANEISQLENVSKIKLTVASPEDFPCGKGKWRPEHVHWFKQVNWTAITKLAVVENRLNALLPKNTSPVACPCQ
ncbi:hypothetical protein CBER1_05823 [Cercospora berteroae]|uniref:DUF7730 domain-containing protein n=1 Tax=Cercospora berteroae TaxID=357750 RepID=A0A2S6C2K0_9PEZI|nr:hypothetical protein CBER1_05823 [Cercospora berteroae]